MVANAGNPTPAYFSMTGDRLTDGMTHGYFWRLDASKTIDMAVAGGFLGEYWNNPAAVSTHFLAAGFTFSIYADVKFNFSGVYSDPSSAFYSGADITLSADGGYRYFASQNSWARGFFPDTVQNLLYAGAPGDIYLNLNSQANYLPSYQPGSSGWFLILHELGHTLGLKHPHDSGGTGRPTFTQLGMEMLDKDWATVMSYGDDADWNLIEWEPATPMILDVYAIQYLYGKNNSFNTGNNSYTLDETGFYITLWDASGTDTLDASKSDVAWKITMPDISLSTLVDTRAGLAIPMKEVGATFPKTVFWLAGDYERANGSRFNDSISGNLFNNTINGNGGNDTIDGGRGSDTAVYSGLRSGYTVTKTSSGVTVKDNVGLDGVDMLNNIERLQFSDKIVALDTDGIAGKAYRIYQAAFARTPDNGGLKYWIDTMDKGHTLEAVAGGFIASTEFKSLYGNAPSNEMFVTKLYNNVLGRAPEKGGFDYWVGLLDDRKISQVSTLINFSESGENQAALIGVIENGIELFA